MHGIFISYRRIDTLPWAGPLFADLRKSFGASEVFMDINGGIPRGADFEQVLTTALKGCEALLALIGPQRAGCERSDKTRRLDAPDDRVRNEISGGKASADRQGIVRRQRLCYSSRRRGARPGVRVARGEEG